MTHSRVVAQEGVREVRVASNVVSRCSHVRNDAFQSGCAGGCPRSEVRIKFCFSPHPCAKWRTPEWLRRRVSAMCGSHQILLLAAANCEMTPSTVVAQEGVRGERFTSNYFSRCSIVPNDTFQSCCTGECPRSAVRVKLCFPLQPYAKWRIAEELRRRVSAQCGSHQILLPAADLCEMTHSRAAAQEGVRGVRFASNSASRCSKLRNNALQSGCAGRCPRSAVRIKFWFPLQSTISIPGQSG